MTDPTQTTPSMAEMLRLFKIAGIEPHEYQDDPEHGLVLYATGVNKLCSIAPDSYMKSRLRQDATAAARNAMRRSVK